jgi:hypothetical protein
MKKISQREASFLKDLRVKGNCQRNDGKFIVYLEDYYAEEYYCIVAEKNLDIFEN